MKRWQIAAVIVAAAIGVWYAREAIACVLGLLLGGTVIAILIDPLTKRLEKRMPRTAAILFAWLLVFAILFMGVGSLAPVIWMQAGSLFDAAAQMYASLEPRIVQFGGMAGIVEALTGMTGSLLNVVAQLSSGIGAAAGMISRFVLMWIVSIFLLIEKERYLLMAELIIPFRYRRNMLRAASRVMRELRLFAGGQAMIGLCVGLLTSAGLLLIGMENALLLGVITGICNLIPYFGPVLAAFPVIMIALSDGWLRAILATGVLIAVQQIDGFLISPRIMSGATGLSPLTVLMAMAAGSTVFGIMGLLLAIPSAITLRIMFAELAQKQHNNRV